MTNVINFAQFKAQKRLRGDAEAQRRFARIRATIEFIGHDGLAIFACAAAYHAKSAGERGDIDNLERHMDAILDFAAEQGFRFGDTGGGQ